MTRLILDHSDAPVVERIPDGDTVNAVVLDVEHRKSPFLDKNDNEQWEFSFEFEVEDGDDAGLLSSSRRKPGSIRPHRAARSQGSKGPERDPGFAGLTDYKAAFVSRYRSEIRKAILADFCMSKK